MKLYTNFHDKLQEKYRISFLLFHYYSFVNNLLLNCVEKVDKGDTSEVMITAPAITIAISFENLNKFR